MKRLDRPSSSPSEGRHSGVSAPLERALPIAGAVLLVLWGAAALADPPAALRGYLLGWDFWLGISVGCLGAALLHQLSGGHWGRDLAPVFDAARAALPWVALLAIPVLAGAGRIYGWASAASAPHVNHRWLNLPFFLARSAAYLLLWCALSRGLAGWKAPHPDRSWPGSGPGLVLWVATVSLAGVDWFMSLEAPWTSAVYGLATAVAYGVAAFAAGAAVTALWAPPSDAGDDHEEPPRRLQDLGNLLLTFLMLWGYLAFSQFLIIWSANLPEEIPWYLRRSAGLWKPATIAIATLHFAVPFLLLLRRDVKRRPKALAGVAALVLAAHGLDRCWTIAPSFEFRPLLPPAAAASWLGVGALWSWAFLRSWRGRPSPSPSEGRHGGASAPPARAAA